MNDDAVRTRTPSNPSTATATAAAAAAAASSRRTNLNMSVEEAEAEDDADALLAEMIEEDGVKTTTKSDSAATATATSSSAVTTTVSVVFPYIFMDSVVAALATTSGERDWTINLPKDVEIEDLILELRRGISDKADVSFKNVSLVLHDKPITFAMDLPAEEVSQFTANKAKELAAEGSLVVKIGTHSESSKPSSSSSSSSSSSNKKLGPPQVSGNRRLDEEIANRRQPPSSSSSNTLPPRHGSKDEEDDNNGWGATAEEQQLRKSLDLTLQELSDKEGLSDVELTDKLKTLRRSTSASPTNDLFSYHQTVIEASR